MSANQKKVRVALWIAQAVVAALFLFAGSMKFVMPAEAMTQGAPIQLPVWFIHFIGVAEICGALGLVLPTLLRIRPDLTPIAAGGLVIIMSGAVWISLMMAVSAAVVPFTVGVLLVAIAYGRAQVAPVTPRVFAARSRRAIELARA